MPQPLTAGTRKAFHNCYGLPLLFATSELVAKKAISSQETPLSASQSHGLKTVQPRRRRLRFSFLFLTMSKSRKTRATPRLPAIQTPLFTRALPAKSAPYRRAPMHCQTHLSDNFSPRRQCLYQGRKVPPQACLRRLDAKLSA